MYFNFKILFLYNTTTDDPTYGRGRSCILVLIASRYRFIRIAVLPATDSAAQWIAALPVIRGVAGSNPSDTMHFFENCL